MDKDKYIIHLKAHIIKEIQLNENALTDYQKAFSDGVLCEMRESLLHIENGDYDL
jgi:hypothetical protein